MYNATLESTSNQLFFPLGGYAGVYPYLTDDQIAEACFFNGPTWYTSPYQTTYGDGTIPYYLFDLLSLGYQPNTKYSIYNSEYEHQFTEIATPINYEGESRYFWGMSTAAIKLLSNADHASRWFLKCNTPTGPVLSQFFVNKTFDSAAINRSLDQLYDSTPSDSQPFNEVFIYFPPNQTLPLRLVSATAAYESVTSLNDLLQQPNVAIADYLSHNLSAYLQPKSNTWLCLVAVNGDTLLPITYSEIAGLDSWPSKIITDTNSYQLLYVAAGSTNRSAPMSRLSGGLGSAIATNFLTKDKLLIQVFCA